MKRLILSVLSGLLLVGAYAQDYAFKVLASKGSNQVKVGTSYSALAGGVKIQEGNAVKVVSGGYVGLISASGKMLELKQAGEFTTADLAKQLKSGSSDFSSKYSSFVVNQMTGGSGSQNMEVTGSVDRGIESANTDYVKILAPSDITVLQSIVTEISWDGGSKSGFEVRIYNFFNQTLLKKEVKGNQVSINFKESNLKAGEQYILQVVSLENKVESKQHKITILDPAKEKEIVLEMASLQKEVDNSTAMGNLVMASFFEEKNLPIYSLEKFEKAIEIEPEVTDFQVSYRSYLASKGVAARGGK